MKGKKISIITNSVLLVLIAITSVVGFVSGSSVAVSGGSDNLYYGASASANEVALMFNVYQNGENVYKIMNILDEYSAKCTFFIGGSWADDNVDCVREIYKRGHEVASHGYFHKDHSKMNFEANYREIAPSVKLLNMITGDNVTLFAPPSGAYCDATTQACAKLNLKVIMWSRDTIDWRDSDSALIYSRATENLQGGEFVLMHPTEATVTALPNILNYIADSGLKAVTVSRTLGEQ